MRHIASPGAFDARGRGRSGWGGHVWRFHRYYIRELLANLSLTFVMLFGISVLALVARGIYRSQGLDLLIGLWITLLWSIDTIPHLLSISALVASVFTFGRAAADNEITAMRMTGTSPLRLMGAVLFVGALAASANAWLLHNAIPYVHFMKYRPTADTLKLFLMSNRPRQNKLELQDNLMLMWKTREGMQFADVRFKAASRRDGGYIGKADELQIDHDVSNDALRLTLTNFEGQRLGNSDSFETAKLVLTFGVSEILEKNKRAEGLKDLPTAQLVAEVQGGVSERSLEARWYVWLRTFQAFASLLFALIGLPIGIVFRRAGRMVAFAISFVPLALYYGMMFAAPWVARKTQSAWPAVIPDVGLVLAFLLLSRKAFRQ